MAGNRKPRKQYQPKSRTVPSVFGVSAAAGRHMQLVPHQCLEDMKAGRDPEMAWQTLAARVNIGCTAANRFFPEAEQLMREALEALRMVHARFSEGTFTMRGDEVRLVGEALNLTDDMQARMTRRELMDVTSYVFRTAAVHTL